MPRIQQDFIGRLIHFRSVVISLLFFSFLFYFGRNVIDDGAVSIGSKFGFLMALLFFTMYTSWITGKRLLYIPVQAMIAVFTYGLLFFVDPPLQKLVFTICSSLVFYIGLLGMIRERDNPLDVTAKSFLSITLTTGLFLFYAVGYGLYINYDISLWFFICISSIVLFLVTYSSLHLYSDRKRITLLYTAVITFAMAQLMWMANFWPFNYSTMAIVSLMFYYVLWDLLQSALTGTLSKKRTLVHVVFAVILLFLVLFSTRWVLIS